MELFYQVTQCSRKEAEWKKLLLRVYLCWSVCVDMGALFGVLWWLFK